MNALIFKPQQALFVATRLDKLTKTKYNVRLWYTSKEDYNLPSSETMRQRVTRTKNALSSLQHQLDDMANTVEAIGVGNVLRRATAEGKLMQTEQALFALGIFKSK